MSDERIHKHDWQGGRCKTCGVQQREAESELAASHGWKHESEIHEKLKSLAACAESIRWLLTLIALFIVFIWASLALR